MWLRNWKSIPRSNIENRQWRPPGECKDFKIRNYPTTPTTVELTSHIISIWYSQYSDNFLPSGVRLSEKHLTCFLKFKINERVIEFFLKNPFQEKQAGYPSVLKKSSSPDILFSSQYFFDLPGVVNLSSKKVSLVRHGTRSSDSSTSEKRSMSFRITSWFLGFQSGQ